MLLRARGSLSELGGPGGEEAWAEGAAAGGKGLEGHPGSLGHFMRCGICRYECVEVLLVYSGIVSSS
jgi:hypothetical protein